MSRTNLDAESFNQEEVNEVNLNDISEDEQSMQHPDDPEGIYDESVSDEVNALQHVLFLVLGISETHDIHHAFKENEINDINDLMVLDPMELKGVQFGIPDPQDEVIRIRKTLPIMILKKLSMIREWYFEQEPKNMEMWFRLRNWEFAQFCTKHAQAQRDATKAAWNTPMRSPGVAIGSNVQTTVISPMGHTVSSTSTKSTLKEFKKSIKRSSSDYGTLKEDKHWKPWHRSFLATAIQHDLKDVLDESFNPTDPEEKALLEAMNSFLYSVMQKTLLTVKSKSIMEPFHLTQDGRGIYFELIKQFENEIAVEDEATKLRVEITNLVLDEGWKSTLENFLYMWTKKIYTLGELEGTEIDPKTKRTWLCSALQQHKIMKHAITAAKRFERTNATLNSGAKKKLDFHEFYHLVLDEACERDLQRKVKAPPGQTNATETTLAGGRGAGRG